MSRPFAALALALTMPIAVGCGSTTSSSSSKQQAPSVSRASTGSSASSTAQTEFVVRADTICRRIATERERLKFASPSQFRSLLPHLSAYDHALFSQLSKLTAPSSMAADWKQIIADVKALADSTASVAHAVRTRHASGAIRLFDAFSQAHARLRSQAERIGMQDCAHYGTAWASR